MMYDVAIIGAGPAGISAAIYCARYRLRTILISYNLGGWVNNAYIIENLPSKPSVAGADLVKSYKQHIKNNEIEFKKETVIKIMPSFIIKTNKAEYEARYLIYAMGTKKRMLNVPGEGKFLGKGVHTCAICDAPFYQDKKVAVVGGNDAGAKTCFMLSGYAKSIDLIELMPNLPAEPAWKEKLQQEPKVMITTGVTVKEILGEDSVEGIVLTDGQKLDVQGVFIEIGSDPSISIAKDAGVTIDKYNCVQVDASQKTDIDRFYAAGDVTSGSNYVRQIATAQAEGAIAANSIYRRMIMERK